MSLDSFLKDQTVLFSPPQLLSHPSDSIRTSEEKETPCVGVQSQAGEKRQRTGRPYILRSELMQQEFAQIFTFMQDF